MADTKILDFNVADFQAQIQSLFEKEIINRNVLINLIEKKYHGKNKEQRVRAERMLDRFIGQKEFDRKKLEDLDTKIFAESYATFLKEEKFSDEKDRALFLLNSTKDGKIPGIDKIKIEAEEFVADATKLIPVRRIFYTHDKESKMEGNSLFYLQKIKFFLKEKGKESDIKNDADGDLHLEYNPDQTHQTTNKIEKVYATDNGDITIVHPNAAPSKAPSEEIVLASLQAMAADGPFVLKLDPQQPALNKMIEKLLQKHSDKFDDLKHIQMGDDPSTREPFIEPVKKKKDEASTPKKKDPDNKPKEKAEDIPESEPSKEEERKEPKSEKETFEVLKKSAKAEDIGIDGDLETVYKKDADGKIIAYFYGEKGKQNKEDLSKYINGLREDEDVKKVVLYGTEAFKLAVWGEELAYRIAHPDKKETFLDIDMQHFDDDFMILNAAKVAIIRKHQAEENPVLKDLDVKDKKAVNAYQKDITDQAKKILGR